MPLAAFTATADQETQEEIVQKLFGRREAPRSFLRGFDRPNIHLAFAAKDSPRRQILEFAAARKGQSGIVYCGKPAPRPRRCPPPCARPATPACFYHGGMEAEDRRNRRDPGSPARMA